MAAKNADSKQKMTDLKNQLSENKLHKLYLFFGEESFLMDYYIGQITKLIPHMDFEEFNHITLDSDSSLYDVSQAMESFPMMTDRKLVLFKDSGAFKSKTAEATKDFYKNLLENIPDDTVVVFRETDVDKRSGVYKAAEKHGFVLEFLHPDDTDLVTWVIRETKNMGKKISRENAAFLINMSDRSLLTLKNELLKLCSYSDEEITAPVINRLASKTLEAKVFDLCDCMMKNDTEGALIILEQLKTNKESPFLILYTAYSTFSKLLKCKILTRQNIAYDIFHQELGVPKFFVQKYKQAAKSFTEEHLSRILMDITMLDLSVKRGELPQWQAVERLVLSGGQK